MRFPLFRSDEFQRGLTRAGTAVWLITGIALLAVTIRAQWASPAAVSTALAAPASAESARRIYQPSTSLASGEEIVLIFIGASFCNAQKRAGFPTVVKTAKVRLQAYAKGLRFRAIGVALDWPPRTDWRSWPGLVNSTK
jgi:hypothetical protein